MRQHYLRDDLPTGCPQLDAPELEPRLSAVAPRYLVLDTNVVLHQIDLLERPALTHLQLLRSAALALLTLSLAHKLAGLHRYWHSLQLVPVAVFLLA